MSAPPRPIALAHFLPDLLPGEHEVVRLIITRGFAVGHLSLRTRRDPASSSWRHRLVDEHCGLWRLRPGRTLRPLTAASASAILHGAASVAGPFSNGDPIGTVWATLRLDEVPGAVRLCSPRFPDLVRAHLQRERAYLVEWGAASLRLPLRSAAEQHRLRA